MKRKNVLAILMAGLMLVTILNACISVNAKDQTIEEKTLSGNGSIRVELDFAETLPPVSRRIGCDGMAAYTDDENGVQCYTFTGLSRGFHTIQFCSGPPYFAFSKLVYLRQGQDKTVTLDVLDLNQRTRIIPMIIRFLQDLFDD